MLIKIAIKTAKYENVRFDPKKPNWRYLRKLALLIYTRLRDSEVYKFLSPSK